MIDSGGRKCRRDPLSGKLSTGCRFYATRGSQRALTASLMSINGVNFPTQSMINHQGNIFLPKNWKMWICWIKHWQLFNLKTETFWPEKQKKIKILIKIQKKIKILTKKNKNWQKTKKSKFWQKTKIDKKQKNQNFDKKNQNFEKKKKKLTKKIKILTKKQNSPINRINDIIKTVRQWSRRKSSATIPARRTLLTTLWLPIGTISNVQDDPFGMS